MHRSWNIWCSLQRMVFAVAIGACGVFIYLIWFGMNSDRDNVPPLLTQLIPAGHCTCQSSTSFQCADCLTYLALPPPLEPEHLVTWRFQYGRDDHNLGLSQSQCQAAFPGLFQDIQRGVGYWKSRGIISRDDLSTVPFEDGMARAIISNGDLYVVAARAKGDDHRRKILGTLGSIHRALSASLNRTSHPTIEFIFSIEDRVDDVDAVSHPVWVLSRKASEESVILMPDFGFWSWAKSNIGPYGQVVQSIMAAESNLKFADKEQKLVWRGKLSFAPKLRRALLDNARGKPWSDVKELDWRKKANFLSMEDHCRYMFIGHVEGRAYSASLKYRQACRSVIVAHKLQHIQHHHYLLVSSGPEQNYVEVERDFSDLPKRMDELLKNPDKAERIANNSVKTFRERYLTPAAEACYWRALWEGWAEVSANVTRDVERPPVERGLRYESFVMLDSNDMLEYSFGSE
ncbi:glycosyl transferase family 90-domain-containing protein [Aspergillus bertholletiae]|uniref:Glycosyl transferase family 90-domain-containing protein n=1 Tax=Aspergillus bertholletiae TaxID=1226010 RepID=A0A5N7B6T9_9EURO|nr:glycosyl transferase family 90-domain-containing protein [Aspergillus bertholletiae]